MQDKKRVENFWREPPRGLFIHFVLLIKKRRLKSSQKSLTFWGHYTQGCWRPPLPQKSQFLSSNSLFTSPYIFTYCTLMEE